MPTDDLDLRGGLPAAARQKRAWQLWADTQEPDVLTAKLAEQEKPAAWRQFLPHDDMVRMLTSPVTGAYNSLAEGVDLAQRAGVANSLAAVPVAAYEAGKNLLTEGIHTADRWVNATHQLPGARPTDTLVAPAGTEDYSINPNRVEGHDVLAPLGLAGIGSPIRNLGRASVGASRETVRPSVGEAVSKDALPPKHHASEAPSGAVLPEGVAFKETRMEYPGGEEFSYRTKVGPHDIDVSFNRDPDFPGRHALEFDIDGSLTNAGVRQADWHGVLLAVRQAVDDHIRKHSPRTIHFDADDPAKSAAWEAIGKSIAARHGGSFVNSPKYGLTIALPKKTGETLLADQNRSSWLGNIANALMGRDEVQGISRAGRAVEKVTPSEALERPVSAAIKIGDQTFRGPTHFDALRSAVPEVAEQDLFGGALKQALEKKFGTAHVEQDGFVTSPTKAYPNGRYVDRKEALELLKKADDYKRPLGDGLVSPGQLDAVELEKHASKQEGRKMWEGVAPPGPVGASRETVRPSLMGEFDAPQGPGRTLSHEVSRAFDPTGPGRMPPERPGFHVDESKVGPHRLAVDYMPNDYPHGRPDGKYNVEFTIDHLNDDAGVRPEHLPGIFNGVRASVDKFIRTHDPRELIFEAAGGDPLKDRAWRTMGRSIADRYGGRFESRDGQHVIKFYADQQRASLPGVMANGLNQGIEGAGRNVEKVTPPRVENPIRVYHGSPHDFDKFDSSKIGTGEGAQAFGHGLYFAEREGVARSYQHALSNPSQFGPKSPPSGTPEWVASNVLNVHQGDKQKALADLHDDIARWKNSSYREMFSSNIAKHEAAVKLVEASEPRGRLYEVSLHAKPEQFLDWDLPLSKQSEGVRQVLRDVISKRGGPDIAKYGGDDLLTHRRGDFSAFDLVKSYFGHDNARASQALREAGITGIRYKDQGSRGKEGGTSNYVVFPGNEHLIEIIGKDGKPLQGEAKAKAVKELYAKQGMPVPGEDREEGQSKRRAWEHFANPLQ